MNLMYVKDECNSTRQGSVIIRTGDRLEYSLRRLAEEFGLRGVLDTEVGGIWLGLSPAPTFWSG